ncbi:hypothetical protein H0H93_003301 [Arthromyces matolae]|nr:hypothetical protein H0H93_003301 [Arthromyces matolae]
MSHSFPHLPLFNMDHKTTSQPDNLNFCEVCKCQRCQKIQKYGRCENCTCDNCENYLPGHDYHPPSSESDESQTDSSDSDAAPDPPVSVVTVTPMKRTAGRSMSTQQKLAVREAALAAAPNLGLLLTSLGFCLMSLMNDLSIAIQTCHIIAQGIVGNNDAICGFIFIALFLNPLIDSDASALVIVDASWHVSFDRDHWALVPLDQDYLRKLDTMEFTIDTPLNSIYEADKTFRYAFLPFPSMQRPTVRMNSQNQAEIHSPPYLSFPIIESHARPHYIIYNLVSKVRKGGHDLKELAKNRPQINGTIIRQLEEIYDKWMGAKAPAEFKGDKKRTEKTAFVDMGV